MFYLLRELLNFWIIMCFQLLKYSKMHTLLVLLWRQLCAAVGLVASFSKRYLEDILTITKKKTWTILNPKFDKEQYSLIVHWNTLVNFLLKIWKEFLALQITRLSNWLRFDRHTQSSDMSLQSLLKGTYYNGDQDRHFRIAQNTRFIEYLHWICRLEFFHWYALTSSSNW